MGLSPSACRERTRRIEEKEGDERVVVTRREAGAGKAQPGEAPHGITAPGNLIKDAKKDDAEKRCGHAPSRERLGKRMLQAPPQQRARRHAIDDAKRDGRIDGGP